MKICIFGAGAIGSLLAVLLKQAGHEVSVVARGAHLAAIRRDGLRLVMGGQTTTVGLVATEDPTDLGPQDLVICSLKAFRPGKAPPASRPSWGPTRLS